MAERIRLQKFLANAGVASRRKAEELIQQGRVRVNGVVVTELGTRVDPAVDRVDCDAAEVRSAAAIWIALYKPPRFLTSRGDTHGRRTVYDLLPREFRGLFYVGRLDYETEGLVLMTNDGDGAQRLQHPRYEQERVYEALVKGSVLPHTVQQLLSGVVLEDGPARLLQVDVLAGEGGRTRLRVTLAEGRKREVRRLFAAVGHEVLQLKRLRFGPIELGDLRPGQWRPLRTDEIAALDSGTNGNRK